MCTLFKYGRCVRSIVNYAKYALDVLERSIEAIWISLNFPIECSSLGFHSITLLLMSDC